MRENQQKSMREKEGAIGGRNRRRIELLVGEIGSPVRAFGVLSNNLKQGHLFEPNRNLFIVTKRHSLRVQ